MTIRYSLFVALDSLPKVWNISEVDSWPLTSLVYASSSQVKINDKIAISLPYSEPPPALDEVKINFLV